MESQIPHYTTKSIRWVLLDYETCIEAIIQNTRPTGNQNQSPPNDSGTTIPRASVGTLELDPEEALIVTQEVLSHWIARLMVTLRDVEEEVALQRRRQRGVDYALHEEDMKDLATRLFRLLGRVDGLGVGR